MEISNTVLIIFAIVLVYLLYVMTFGTSCNINLAGIRVDWSKTKNGRGVFANKDFKKGDVVEYAPFVVINKNDCTGRIKDYTFKHYHDDTKSLMVLGYGMLYNHDDDHNIGYSFDEYNSVLIFKARRDIKKDEELFDSYGKEWWSERNLKTKM
jgi:hypothetical protein